MGKSDVVPVPATPSTDARPPRPNKQVIVEPIKLADATGLANALLAIQERHGVVYMLDLSRYLIEKWDLRSDNLTCQSKETRGFVAKMLGE
jgi:hypothetical protein